MSSADVRASADVWASASAMTPNSGAKGRLDRRLKSSTATRSARRQRLARHLHRCGERPVLEALLAVEGGKPLDVVLEDFARLQPAIYHALSADLLPIDEKTLIQGARRWGV
jgi:hypothetical protein